MDAWGDCYTKYLECKPAAGLEGRKTLVDLLLWPSENARSRKERSVAKARKTKTLTTHVKSKKKTREKKGQRKVAKHHGRNPLGRVDAHDKRGQ